MNGYAAETIVSSLIRQNQKLKPVSFNSHKLIEVARRSKLGRRRLEAALPYLALEYGNARLELDWDNVPPTVILDLVFGLDCCFQVLGWIVGIDVTANPTAISQKQQKLKRLSPLWQAIGIDRTAVCFVDANMVFCQAAPTLFENFRSIVRGNEIIAIK